MAWKILKTQPIGSARQIIYSIFESCVAKSIKQMRARREGGRLAARKKGKRKKGETRMEESAGETANARYVRRRESFRVVYRAMLSGRSSSSVKSTTRFPFHTRR